MTSVSASPPAKLSFPPSGPAQSLNATLNGPVFGVRYAKQKSRFPQGAESFSFSACSESLPRSEGVSSAPIGGVSNKEGEHIMANNGPAQKLRDGCLQVLIWRNTTTDGKTFYSLTPQRSYRQGDDTWRETDSLNADDALPMAELLREAYAWIKMQKRADAKAAKERDNVTAK